MSEFPLRVTLKIWFEVLGKLSGKHRFLEFSKQLYLGINVGNSLP